MTDHTRKSRRMVVNTNFTIFWLKTMNGLCDKTHIDDFDLLFRFEQGGYFEWGMF